MSRIESEIARFLDVPRRARALGFGVEEYGEAAFVLHQPTDGGALSHKSKGAQRDLREADLCFAGIIHGNEWAGATVLNEVVDLLLEGTARTQLRVGFLFGNLRAAPRNVRFLERDLNRSFPSKSADQEPGGADTVAPYETTRAHELANLLGKTRFLVDFHQTSRHTPEPFFIFGHTAASFAFARNIDETVPIITHWGAPFSSEGMCSDEYVNSQGGTGITVELGRNGFEPKQIAAGVRLSLRSLSVVGARAESRLKAVVQAPVYTWANVVPYPSTGTVVLREWNNFDSVPAGAELGRCDGRPITAPCGGYILFPKYMSSDEQSSGKRPAELLRIMTAVPESELPAR